MFPTTMWSTIHRAGQHDPAALATFAERYRPALLDFIRGRGFAASDADDIVQDVFVRLIHGRVLAKADPARGRLRSLLLGVTRFVLADRGRARARTPRTSDIDPESLIPGDQPDATEFDRAWVLHLAEMAMRHLRDSSSPYYDVLRGQMAGEKQNRNKLWIARKKLIARIRHEVAMTCQSHAEFEEEVAYLSQFLRPPGTHGPSVGPAESADLSETAGDDPRREG